MRMSFKNLELLSHEQIKIEFRILFAILYRDRPSLPPFVVYFTCRSDVLHDLRHPPLPCPRLRTPCSSLRMHLHTGWHGSWYKVLHFWIWSKQISGSQSFSLRWLAYSISELLENTRQRFERQTHAFTFISHMIVHWKQGSFGDLFSLHAHNHWTVTGGGPEARLQRKGMIRNAAFGCEFVAIWEIHEKRPEYIVGRVILFFAWTNLRYSQDSKCFPYPNPFSKIVTWQTVLESCTSSHICTFQEVCVGGVFWKPAMINFKMK